MPDLLVENTAPVTGELGLRISLFTRRSLSALLSRSSTVDSRFSLLPMLLLLSRSAMIDVDARFKLDGEDLLLCFDDDDESAAPSVDDEILLRRGTGLPCRSSGSTLDLLDCVSVAAAPSISSVAACSTVVAALSRRSRLSISGVGGPEVEGDDAGEEDTLLRDERELRRLRTSASLLRAARASATRSNSSSAILFRALVSGSEASCWAATLPVDSDPVG